MDGDVASIPEETGKSGQSMEKFCSLLCVECDIGVIRFAVEDWFFSHDCNVCVKLDDVKLPKVEGIGGESLEEKVKRQIEALPKAVLFVCQILLVKGEPQRVYASLYDTDAELHKCFKLLETCSSNDMAASIPDQELFDFASKGRDKKQSLTRWVKDYLENEYPGLTFTFEEEGVPVSSTQMVTQRYLCLDDDAKKWRWIVLLEKDGKRTWKMTHLVH